jgi:membrane-bound metal-dependent hydrolase YbcI (DUF457 family)
MMPDLDSILGVIAKDFRGFHNLWTHSLIVGSLISISLSFFFWSLTRSGFLKWFFLILLSYELHIIADFFTQGRGVMLFWPLSEERYSSPISLFYGVRWSEGLFTIKHLWTLASELITVGGVYFLLNSLERRRLKRLVTD